jgi:mucin-19
MSSTFSTNLALELIGTGDQAGAWGNTTNTNLGTLIEQAISGYVTQAVVTGTDTTLTIPNGATGVARNMYIELTGTGGTNTNLIVPANKKLYFIYNNSTGAVTVKVFGLTGVSVPTGKKMLLVSNGTDIVNGLNYIADFGTNSFTVTNLTATSATITTLTSPSANITTLTGTTLGYTSASLTNLAVTSLTVSSLSLSNATFTSATITTLKSTSATIDNLASTSAVITNGTVTNLTAPSASITTLTGTSANITTLTGSSMNVTTATHASANITTLAGTTANYTSATISNLNSPSANISTLTGTNATLTSLTLTNALRVSQGGTGQTSTPTNGQLLIGNGSGFALSTLTAGAGVGITNNAGSITITATGTGFIASVNATSPLQSVGTDSITISIASSTGSGAVVLASGAQFSATSANITTLTSTSSNITTLTGTSATITTLLDGAGNVRKIPSAGSEKTSTYTLAITDIGEFVTVGASGAVDVPNNIFSAGDAISIFNNTAGNVTISLTITTAYLSGTDSDKASVTLATRGVATVLFINPSLCVLTGALS